MQNLPLRSKTGCLVCRKRHKKCDERKPNCGDCRRLGFDCTWEPTGISYPANTSIQKDLTELLRRGHEEDRLVCRAPSLVRRGSLVGNVTGNGYRAFRSQAQFELVVQSPRHLGALISRSAVQEFHNTSVLVTLALQHDWLRDALAAFSAFNLGASDSSPSGVQQIGIDMYQSALLNVRRHIMSTPTRVATIEILTAITFLGIFESLGTGDGKLALQHFVASLKISSCMPVPPASRPIDLMLYRIAVECWLYNLATLAVYYRFPDHVMERLDQSFLDKVFHMPSGSYDLALRTSPFIGGSHVMYKIMLQVTWFARQNLPIEVRLRQTSKWASELDLIMERLQSYFSVLPDDVASLYYWKSVLHVYATRIFLVKIADHRSSSSSPAIRKFLAVARGIFEHNTTHETHNPALAWPLVIFLCASHEDSTFDFFQSMVFTIRDNFDPGHRKRLSAVLDVLRQRRMDPSCCDSTDCQLGHDTLDLLLSEEGIIESQFRKESPA